MVTKMIGEHVHLFKELITVSMSFIRQYPKIAFKHISSPYRSLNSKQLAEAIIGYLCACGCLRIYASSISLSQFCFRSCEWVCIVGMSMCPMLVCLFVRWFECVAIGGGVFVWTLFRCVARLISHQLAWRKYPKNNRHDNKTRFKLMWARWPNGSYFFLGICCTQ